MRRPIIAIVFLVLAALLGTNFAASAASYNDTACRKGIDLPWNSEKVVAYDACRFDKLDSAVKALQSTTGPTTGPTAPPTTQPPTTPPTTAPPTTPPTTAPAGSVCQAGKEVVKFAGAGSAGLGQYGQGNYDASAELWGVNGYNYEQTMGVCTHDSWYVNVKTDNTKADGAVKAYPSMRRIYHDWSTTDFSKDPLVTSFPQLKVDFAATEPASCSGCIYDTAFDVWLNGIGNGNANELMIWTYNVGQRPFGSKVASGVQVDGRSWDLWTGNSNHYIAYVPTGGNIPSGTVDIKKFTTDLASRGIIKSDSRLGQISYGVESVSTGAVSKRWDFTKFNITDS